LLIYIHQEELQYYYHGDTAMFLENIAPLFFLGMFYLLWRWRRPAILLAGWVILAAVANGLVKDSFVYARYVVVLPALAILLAVGVSYVLPLIIPLKNQTRANTLTWVAIALIAVIHVNYYFGTHIAVFEQQLRTSKPYRDGFDAVLRTLDKPKNTQILVISDPENDRNVLRPFLSFFWNNEPSVSIDSYNHARFTREVLDALPRDRNYVFFLVPNDYATVDLIRDYFALEGPEYSPYDDVPLDNQYVMYYAPLQDTK
jgi:hypothetical protein